MIIDKDIQSSIKLFSFLKDEFPDSWKAYLNLAYSYKNNGQTDLARETALKAQELNSANKDIKELLEALTQKE
jgi:Flp pilus assembly protein TadD